MVADGKARAERGVCVRDRIGLGALDECGECQGDVGAGLLMDGGKEDGRGGAGCGRCSSATMAEESSGDPGCAMA